MAGMAYDPKLVNVILDGRIVTGFGDSLVTVERENDRVIPFTGVKGEYGAAISYAGGGTITLTLQQQSPMNQILQAYANDNREFPIEIVDANSYGFKAGGNEAMIIKEPAYERTGEFSVMAWAIHVFDFTVVPT